MSPQGISVVPSNGWSYYEDGMRDPLTAPGYVELVKLLEGYRIANGKPIGNPSVDINAYVTKNNPRLFGRVPPPDPYAPTKVVPKVFREEITNSLASLFQNAAQGTLQYVDEDESERRAKICASCPQNKSWKTGCPPCVENAERVILMLSHGRKTSQDKDLGGCGYFRHANQVAVVLDQKHLDYPLPQRQSAPEQCWLHNFDT